MTTTPPTTPITIPHGDPHGLAHAGEPTATEAELHDRYGVSSGRLRWLRKRRGVRYIDRLPGLPAGMGSADRYLYSVADVERAKHPPPPKPAPRPSPPHAPPPLAARAPEVIVRRRRAS